ncbi:hypothetical protein GCM10025751_38850 [Haladaptatus pallidirubidus]|uniref:Transposase n=1 Tax=Haladaptatus pallidirubidus TaxID=1008152 RepID=A0AAV3ULK7_9EURY
MVVPPNVWFGCLNDVFEVVREEKGTAVELAIYSVQMHARFSCYYPRAARDN